MKKLLCFISVTTIFYGCSSDENNNLNANSVYAKKWYIGDKIIALENGQNCENNYYDLKSNGNIEYKYRVGSNICEHEFELGTWKVESDILLRTFPSYEGTQNGFTMRDQIISQTGNTLVLKNLDNNRETIYYFYE